MEFDRKQLDHDLLEQVEAEQPILVISDEPDQVVSLEQESRDAEEVAFLQWKADLMEDLEQEVEDSEQGGVILDFVPDSAIEAGATEDGPAAPDIPSVVQDDGGDVEYFQSVRRAAEEEAPPPDDGEPPPGGDDPKKPKPPRQPPPHPDYGNK